jgi:hypothetical protein
MNDNTPFARTLFFFIKLEFCKMRNELDLSRSKSDNRGM